MAKADKNFEAKMEAHLSELALRMALHCVRNTVIENYHAADKITDEEMMAFNKEVVNNLYTFLQLILNPKYKELQEVALFPKTGFPIYYPAEGWDDPKLDDKLIAILQRKLAN